MKIKISYLTKNCINVKLILGKYVCHTYQSLILQYICQNKLEANTISQKLYAK